MTMIKEIRKKWNASVWSGFNYSRKRASVEGLVSEGYKKYNNLLNSTKSENILTKSAIIILSAKTASGFSLSEIQTTLCRELLDVGKKWYEGGKNFTMRSCGFRGLLNGPIISVTNWSRTRQEVWEEGNADIHASENYLINMKEKSVEITEGAWGYDIKMNIK